MSATNTRADRRSQDNFTQFAVDYIDILEQPHPLTRQPGQATIDRLPGLKNTIQSLYGFLERVSTKEK